MYLHIFRQRKIKRNIIFYCDYQLSKYYISIFCYVMGKGRVNYGYSVIQFEINNFGVRYTYLNTPLNNYQIFIN